MMVETVWLCMGICIGSMTQVVAIKLFYIVILEQNDRRHAVSAQYCY